MTLSDLQTVVDQVAASETYGNLDFEVSIDKDTAKDDLLFSAEDPPNFYDWDLKLNVTDAELTIKDGIEL